MPLAYRPRRASLAAPTPAEEESILRTLGRATGSGVSRAVNFLDLPGSMARDVLTWLPGGPKPQNPFDQLLTPFRSENRITGREFLEGYGMRRNRETGIRGWFDDPGEAVRDIAGTVFEVGTDPLTPLTLGGSSFGKAGRILKDAGALDSLLSQGGKRLARLTTSIDDVIEPLAQAARSGDSAAAQSLSAIDLRAQSAGLAGLDDLRRLHGADKLGSFARWAGMPVGTGKLAQQAARGMDALGQTLRWSGPGRMAYQAFGGARRGMRDKVPQMVAEQVTRNQAVALQDSRALLARVATELQGHLPKDVEEAKDFMFRIFEGVEAPPPQLAGTVDLVRQFYQKQLADKQEWGSIVKALDDTDIEDYVARAMDTSAKPGGGKSGPMFVRDPNAKHRAGILRGAMGGEVSDDVFLRGGTATLRKMFRDPDLNALIAKGVSEDELATAITAKMAPEGGTPLMSDLYHDIVTKDGVKDIHAVKGRFKELARMMLRTPEELRMKGFYTDPLTSMYQSMERGADIIETQKGILRMLSDDDMIGEAIRTGGVDEMVPMMETLGRLGFDPGGIHPTAFDDAGEMVAGEATGALRKLAELRGVDPTDIDAVRLLTNQEIPKRLADQLTKLYDGFASPEPISDIMQVVTKTTNLLKAGLTGVFPAFHTRNLTSGQFRNFVSGMFDTQSPRDAWTLMRGGTVKGSASIPLLKQQLSARGMDVTDENATTLLREMSFTYFPDLVERTAGEAASRVGAEAAPGSMLGLAESLPGARPFRFREAGRKYIGREPGRSYRETLNPLNVRGGFGDQTVSRFGPVAAGEDIGYFVEGMNRISPFINQLRKGVDPHEAARRVLEAQVDYSGRAYSVTERQGFAALFPFWKFSSRQVPYLLRELAEQPGGVMKQTLRAISGGQGSGDPRVPAHVSETASIPVGVDAEGNRNYITGFGLMEEDPLSFLSPDFGMEILSRVNPLLKGPLEAAVGESFFQRGPMGGRPLDELDPPLARTLGNIIGRDEPVSWAGPFTNPIEQVLSNSPASRLFTTLRQATDPRKSLLNKALNIGSGVKVTTVSPQQQERAMQDYADVLMNETGGRQFSRMYYPAGMELTPEQEKLKQIHRILQAL